MNEFATIEEAQLTATQWLWIYNNERLSMVLGGIAPAMKLKDVCKLKLSTACSF
jgi:putative transposase